MINGGVRIVKSKNIIVLFLAIIQRLVLRALFQALIPVIERGLGLLFHFLLKVLLLQGEDVVLASR